MPIFALLPISLYQCEKLWSAALEGTKSVGKSILERRTLMKCKLIIANVIGAGLLLAVSAVVSAAED